MKLHSKDKYTMYGYTLSYFSRKLETALQWYGVEYEFRCKSIDIRSLIEKRSGTHQVPILFTPQDHCMIDTTPTMWFLDERYPERRMFPSGLTGALVQILEEYLDEWFPRIVLHYRWQYEECTQFAANVLGREAAPGAADLFSNTIAQWGKKACRARGISSEEMKRSAEAEWIRTLDALEEQLGQTAFSLGNRPCAVDADLLGGLRGHFLKDPVPKTVLQNYPRIRSWADTALHWDGKWELAPFPESTPFAHFLLKEMAGSYKKYCLSNAVAISGREKAFVCDTEGHSVSYKTNAYTETSRQLLIQRLTSQLSSEEYTQFISFLEAHDLKEIL
ncbi:MAG: glutathione S-transferase N-terminal domain-containing protein [Myxococcota bacterium]|nr:glutathione S-transferase N-terminal domain-containing protein [Myxococcota bacterium]